MRVIESVDCLVAIDEAYAEFAGVDHTDLALTYDNVITLRTMSKFAGLAGFRVGYGIFPEALMPVPTRRAGLFTTSQHRQAVAIASLDDLDHLRQRCRIIAERERLAEHLTLPGVHVSPSATNFLLVELPVDDARPVVEALARDGLLVRGYGSGDLRHCIRISIGLPEHHDRLIDIVQRELTRPSERVVTA